MQKALYHNKEQKQLIMTDFLSIQTALCLIFVLVVSNEQLTGINECLSPLLTYLAVFAALANDSCEVYPSEYAYQSESNSVIRSERSSAKCGEYASGLSDISGVFTEYYTHCDGTQLRLTDSDLGSEQYSSSDYYVWNDGSHRLLFIFPTRVNLTTITLHYYSDNVRGLPKLKFFALPDDFDVWDAPLASYSHVDTAVVSPGGEPAALRNVRVYFDFMNVKKVQLYKFSSSIILAVSEVEFFTCNSKLTKQKYNHTK